MSFRNRCMIAGGNGIIELSVPLVHGRNQRIPFGAVKIDNRQKWQIIHWRSIVSSYNRSPWFEYYKHGLEELYQTPFGLLSDWNMATWKWSLQQLKHAPFWEAITGAAPEFSGLENEDIKDVSDRWLPRNYTVPDPAFATPVYTQVFEERHGFLPNLSILDLLFCTGPRAMEFLLAD